MLTDQEIELVAQAHVSKIYPHDDKVKIVYREKRSNPDGIYFCANRCTDDPLDVYVGSGGFFVTRKSGEIWEFGSGQIVHEGLDYWLEWYAEGWRPGTYRFTVTQVKKRKLFAELLIKNQFSYQIREVECNTVWHRDVDYNEARILRRIRELPCSFRATGEQLKALIPVLKTEDIAIFDFSYIGDPSKYDWRPENNSADQLGPIYE
jgi:hypothetical protein